MSDAKISVKSTDEELTTALLESDSSSEINAVIDIFNLNIKKKNAIRAAKFSDLQDKVVAQIDNRISCRADEFSNKELLDYYHTIQSVLEKSNSQEPVHVPTIAIQQNINVESVAFDKDSRDRIRLAIQKVLKDSSQSTQDIVDAEVVEEQTTKESTNNE